MASVAAGGEKEKAAKAPSAPRAGAFSGFERMVAWRYLRPRRKEAFISVIAGFSFAGIMIGVAALLIVMAVMNGFRTELISRLLGINGHIVVQAIDRPLDDYADLATRFSAVPGVTMALPLVEGQTLAQGNSSGGTGALVRGVRPEDLEKLKEVSGNIKQGDIVGFASGDGVLVGSRLAASLGLSAGERITLVAPEGDLTPMGPTPRIKSYVISGTFEVGVSDYDASVVYMPLEEAQAYFNVDGVAQSIELFIQDPEAVDDMRPLIEKAAGDRQIFMSDWRQRNQTFFNALKVERNVMFSILTLIVLVAALNIISGMIMLVKDKSSDIAILRTMGASSGAIMRIFFMTGAIIGTTGTMGGVALGVLVCVNIERINRFFSWLSGTALFNPEVYFLSELPADLTLSDTLTVVIMTLTLSYLATILPAWRASRLDPVQALRYE